jgi:arginine/lysine/histidine transport system permease protein
MGTQMINFNLLIKSLPQLIYACKNTLIIAFFSTLIGMIGGTLVALGLRSTFAPLRWLLKTYTTIVRGTPMVVQIVFLYYGLQLPFAPIVVAIIAIGLNSSAYVSQIITAGINAVAIGQVEAAKVMGFSQLQVMRYIVLPQALRVVLPALGNEFITLIKDSSLAYIIGVHELFKESRNLTNVTYDVLTIYLAVTFLYLIMTYSLTLGLQTVEKRWDASC